VLQVGMHPDSGEHILANSGRFGPYLKHMSLTVTLPQGCGPLDVTLEQALAAVAAKETRMRARGRDPYEVRLFCQAAVSSVVLAQALLPLALQCL
jgi:topoisomerase IA-like protein